MITEPALEGLVGLPVLDGRGRTIGTVEAIFAGGADGKPEWIGVATGRLRRQRVVVPAGGARRTGDVLRVPWSRDHVRNAPAYRDRDLAGILGFAQYAPAISEEKERAAAAHYGRRW